MICDDFAVKICENQFCNGQQQRDETWRLSVNIARSVHSQTGHWATPWLLTRPCQVTLFWPLCALCTISTTYFCHEFNWSLQEGIPQFPRPLLSHVQSHGIIWHQMTSQSDYYCKQERQLISHMSGWQCDSVTVSSRDSRHSPVALGHDTLRQMIVLPPRSASGES